MTETKTARIVVTPERTIDTVDPLVFGSFVEKLHRCICGGLYDPESPAAGANPT